MLTVWCVCWGDKYPDYYVTRLKESVAQNTEIPHRFVCVTDRRIPGITTMPPPVDWPGWWGKIGLFKPGFSGPLNLYFDLDVVIVGSIDYLADSLEQHSLAMPENWAQSGHGGCQSSVMVWRDCEINHQIFDLFDPAIAYWPPRNDGGKLWGDQEWLTKLRDDGIIRVRPLPGAKSYKYHCRDGLPKDCRIVVFHGSPKPDEVMEQWFQW